MTEATQRATAAISSRIEGDDLVFVLRGEGGAPFEMRLHSGVAQSLLPVIMAMLATIYERSGSGMDVQPITIGGCRKAVLPDGSPLLVLLMEGKVPLPLTFPRSAIPALQTALAELGKLTSPISSGQPH